MNLICPHCQKLLTVPDENAGLVNRCIHCNNMLTVPSLPKLPPEPSILGDLPVEISLVPEPAAPKPAADPTPINLDLSTRDEPIYKLSPEPPKPTNAPPLVTPVGPVRREDRPAQPTTPRTSSPLPNPKPTAPLPPAPPPSAGYPHTFAIWISPRVVPLIPPIALAVLFLLLFFPWTGAYPGGYSIFTQSAFGMTWGGYSDDLETLGEPKPFESVGWNPLMIFYFLAVLAAVALAAAPFLVAKTSMQMPRGVERIWPWRSAIVGGITACALLILLLQMMIGFGLENALAAPPPQSSENSSGGNRADRQPVSKIQQALRTARMNPQRTFWLQMAILCHLVTVASVGLELWLEKRGQQPMPRIEIQW
jgi:hypothetical protein